MARKKKAFETGEAITEKLAEEAKTQRTKIKSLYNSELRKATALVERYGTKSLSDLYADSGHPKSMLIYKMMAKSGVSFTSLAECLLCNPQSLRNKLSRDIFSLDELITTAAVCGYELVLRKRDGSEEELVDANTYFTCSKDAKALQYWKQLTRFQAETFDRKQKELLQLEEKTKQLKDELSRLSEENERAKIL